MADSDRKDTRKTTLSIALLALLVIAILGAVIVVRGCHQPNDMEDRINPDDPLPGTIDGTGFHHTPDAVPLLRAA